MKQKKVLNQSNNFITSTSLVDTIVKQIVVGTGRKVEDSKPKTRSDQFNSLTKLRMKHLQFSLGLDASNRKTASIHKTHG